MQIPSLHLPDIGLSWVLHSDSFSIFLNDANIQPRLRTTDLVYQIEFKILHIQLFFCLKIKISTFLRISEGASQFPNALPIDRIWNLGLEPTHWAVRVLVGRETVGRHRPPVAHLVIVSHALVHSFFPWSFPHVQAHRLLWPWLGRASRDSTSLPANDWRAGRGLPLESSWISYRSAPSWRVSNRLATINLGQSFQPGVTVVDESCRVA